MTTPADALEKLEAALARSPADFLHLLHSQAVVESDAAWLSWENAVLAIAAVLDTGIPSVRDKSTRLRHALEQPPPQLSPTPSPGGTLPPAMEALRCEINSLQGESARQQDERSRLLLLQQKRSSLTTELARLRAELALVREHINQLPAS